MNKPASIDVETAQPYDVQQFTSTDFVQMMECGAFEDMRVELVGGVLEKMSPSHGDHGSTNGDLFADLRQAYRGQPVWLAIDLAIRVSAQEVRGADVAVAHDATPKDRLVEGHELVLLVEVAQSTLGRDLGDKPVSYARAGVPEYWVVDLPGRVTHVFTVAGVDGYVDRKVIPFGTEMVPPGTQSVVRIA